MISKGLRIAAVAGALLISCAGQAQAGIIGSDSVACTSGEGPAILANISGLKDRAGELKLELYPATPDDFLKDDRDLIKQGKFFRRVRVATPQSGAVLMCIKAPKPGRYALLFTHNRDSKNKFSIWQDGAGLPSNRKIGTSKPKVDAAIVDVGEGVTVTNIKTQYIHGLSGFSPSDGG
jgi:uncharacterized protein (DUF2141 family)